MGPFTRKGKQCLINAVLMGLGVVLSRAAVAATFSSQGLCKFILWFKVSSAGPLCLSIVSPSKESVCYELLF